MTKNKLILAAFALGLSANTFAQPEKFVVVEEKTGTWCGFCPSGMVAMDNLEETEDNFIGIAIHNSDPMANSYYDDASDGLPSFGGYPYAAADRTVGAHAASAGSSFNARKSLTPVASIDVAGYIMGDQLEIRILAKFDEKTTGDWRLAAVVTEDDVTGVGSGWGQANYFSGGSYGALEGAGYDWAAESSTVTGVNYDHVGRLVADNAYSGLDETLPATMEVGVDYWYSYYVDIDASWDLSNISVVAMLIEPSGEINNAGKGRASEGEVGTVGIEEVATSNFSISTYPNPTAGLLNVSLELQDAATVSMEIVNMLGATVRSIETQNLASGTFYNAFDMSELTDGVYFVKTTVDGTVEMSKVVVSK